MEHTWKRPAVPAAPPPAPGTEAGGTPAGGRGGSRISVLDVIRGFALCGILLANFEPVTHMGFNVPVPEDEVRVRHTAEIVLLLLVNERFFPIFAFLFGIGFALLLDSATGRHARPRLVLARRLAALLLLGLGHQVLHPGEALGYYGFFGLVVLLPATYLPRWLILAGGAAATALSLTVFTGGVTLIPGMFLLGLAAVRYRVPQTLADRTGQVAAVSGVLAVAAVAAFCWHYADIAARSAGIAQSGAVAGLLLAGVYTTGLCLLMRTPLRAALEAILAPLGRMALTNYLTATLLMLAAGWWFGFEDSYQWGALFALSAAILAAQWVASTLWLRRFRLGPVEWLLRCVTWWSVVPAAAATAGAVPAAPGAAAPAPDGGTTRP
ncbi:DUF418 domain-containing protein [Nocardiopsis sediminis]|uniref:DUF418 domain-containing protein n=1 Tax=Nocardiopsis sediminis TaxID=1778267 RepID=A0ABV8FJ86_9ACTN